MRFWTKFVSNCFAYFFLLQPKWMRWAGARFLAGIAWYGFKFRRFTLLKNLSIAFPEWPKEKKIQTAKLSLAYLCYNFAEFWLLPFMNEDYLKNKVTFHGLENFERAHAKGKGVLMLSLHLGNGDVGINMIGLKGIKLNVISKTFKNEFTNELWFGARKGRGVRFIEPHGTKTAFEILRACKANESVVFVIDQFMGKPYGIETTFFGKKTGTAYGLALFAIKTDAPVVPVYTYRDEELNTHVAFEPEIFLEPAENRDLQIQLMTQKYTDKVEELVRRHPEHWMWVHRRWKTWG